MRNLVLIFLTLVLVIATIGCAIPASSGQKTIQELDSIQQQDIIQQIEQRYESFSSWRYAMTESLYENGVLTQKTEYTEIIKMPDKIRRASNAEFSGRSRNSLTVGNGNTTYSQDSLSPNLMRVYEYINLSPGTTSVTGNSLSTGAAKRRILWSLDQNTEKRVETFRVDYEGKKAIKVVVTRVMSKEEKQKQLAIGNTPREVPVTYWFDADTLAILKEEQIGHGTGGGPVPVGPVTKGATSTPVSMGTPREIESRVERIYQEFHFDTDILDSEFEVNPSDYPGVRFAKETVDMHQKF